MQQVNDDMDELYRKAAEDYPLETSGADWSKVQTALKQAEAAQPTVRRRDHKQFLWLLLLLPFGWLCNQYIGGSNVEKISPENNQNPSLQSLKLDNDVTANPETVTSGITIQKKVADVVISNSKTSNFSVVNNNQKDYSIKNELNNVVETAPLDHVDVLEKHPPVSLNKIDPLINYSPINFFISPKPTSSNFCFQKISNLSLPLSQKQKRFYAGIMGGIDATTIKSQRVKKMSNDYGLLVGFELNKKWSVESGVYSDKKNYYTAGKYFNASKIYLPTNSKLTQVDGSCRMIEVPVTVKYTITSSAKSAWFTTAGVSSYIMQSEDYDYTYIYPSGYTRNVSTSYSNTSKHLASNLLISGGYTHSLGIADVRIEPYLKIGIKGVGVGSIPLTSTGLHVGISKKLF